MIKKILKAIYSVIPFKRQLYSLIRLFRPAEAVYRHLHFKGVFAVSVNGNSFRIHHNGHQLENDLFWTGLRSWESRSLDLWTQLAKESNVILDVGANTGVYSLLAGTVNPGASIYAFEPLPTVYSYLKKNISLNNFQIEAFNIAVSNSNGIVSFYTDDDFSYGASVNKNHHLENQIELKVASESLDSFIARIKKLPDLVKIDVERHEPEVIEGFINYIKAYHPTMLVEVLDDSVGESLRELLKECHYLYYSVNDKTMQVERMKSMGKSDDFNVLIITEEKANRLGLP